MDKTNTKTTFPLIKKHNIDISKLDFVIKNPDFKIEFDINQKALIAEKLLQAHMLACANVKSGNITKRGFATNICTTDGYWSLGTNFNNTRNEISSICGERSAILKAYNEALIRFAFEEKNKNKAFDFKIKYLCMSSNISLNDNYNFIFPCEDCLSWLNTNRYFDCDTLIFSFEKINNNLKVIATRLINLLPYKSTITSINFNKNKKIKTTNKASDSIKKFNLKNKDINDLIDKTIEQYEQINFANISNQNIAASILANNEIYTASKLDWTKRWFIEPLELACYCAIILAEKEVRVQAICYFGDESPDGVVSIKSLGRIRQKYAFKDTILILNLENEILITTLGEYLPEKFIQGYKI